MWTSTSGSWARKNHISLPAGIDFRLPTEAEWEYAARGGNKSKGYLYAGSDQIEDVAFSDNNSGQVIHPVGQLSPNELGIYDMSGNIAEWCHDQYMVHYYDISPEYNPQGPDDDTLQDTKVYRGGHYDTDYCRVSWRSCTWPFTSKHNLGFRVVY